MVNLEIIPTMLGGRLVQKVVSITLANNTGLLEHTNVPANKRWLLLGIKVNNPDDVARYVVIFKYKEAARTNLIRMLAINTALGANAELCWPNTDADITIGSPANHTEIFVGGNVLTVNWVAGGASAGGTDADGLVIEYIEYDM